MKKTLSIILAMVLLFSALPTTAYAAVAESFKLAGSDDVSGSTGDCTWTYEYDTHTLTITGDGYMADYVAPRFSGENTPWYRWDVNTVVIKPATEGSGGVKYIGEHAFSGLTNLQTVTFLSDVKTIGSAAFYGCEKLYRIRIPDSVETIDRSAFCDCTNIREVTLGKNLKTIGEAAFENDAKLTSIVIPDSVTSIGKHAFIDCSSLQTVDFPDALETIEELAFVDCPSLKSVTLGKNIKTIEYHAFGFKINTSYSSGFEDLTFTINGYSGTAAETYTYNTDFTFVDLSEKINNVSATVTVPRLGNTPSYKATLPYNKGYSLSDKSTNGYQNGIKWYNRSENVTMSPTDTFKSGNQYTISIELKADIGYVYADTVSGTINSNQAAVNGTTTRYKTISYTFTMGTMVMTIKNVDVTYVVEPFAANLPSYEAAIPSDMGYMIELLNSGNWRNGMIWYDENGTELNPHTATFSYGKQYTVKVSLIPSSSGYKFSEGSTLSLKTTGTINGGDAATSVENSGQNCYVSRTFTCTAEMLDKAGCAVTQPCTGNKPNYSAISDDNAFYTAKINSWYLSAGRNSRTLSPDDTFEAGKKYRAYVTFTAKNGYAFADDAVFTINGLPATKGERGTYYVEFTAGDAPSYTVGDANNDGRITIKDALAIQRDIADIEPIFYWKAGDFNCDDVLDIKDVTLLQKYIADFKYIF